MRDSCMTPVGQFGVEWGFANANRYSRIYLKDLMGRINNLCARDAPVTENQLKRLFPGTQPGDMRAMKHQMLGCVQCVSGQMPGGAQASGQAECGRRLLQSIYAGMNKFWNEIERNYESF